MFHKLFFLRVCYQPICDRSLCVFSPVFFPFGYYIQSAKSAGACLFHPGGGNEATPAGINHEFGENLSLVIARNVVTKQSHPRKDCFARARNDKYYV